jgi:hypothetical protein
MAGDNEEENRAYSAGAFVSIPGSFKDASIMSKISEN